jgi:protein PsiE
MAGHQDSKNIDSYVGKGIEQAEKILLLGIAVATLWAAGHDVVHLFQTANKMNLADLFLLFIYAEILGMVGAFYSSHRIPVTLPIIIAMTALTRMIVLQTKDLNALNIVWESLGILILSVSAYIMSHKDKLSLEKEKLRKENEK